MEKDIYIKDGGYFATVILTSNKAKEIGFTADVTELDIDRRNDRIDVWNEDLYKVLSWSISHDLTVDSEVSISIPEKED